MLPMLIATLGPMLAKQGLGLLSNVFSGALDSGTKKIAEKINEKTGIDILSASPENPLTEEDLLALKDFELQSEEMILDYLNAQAERDQEMGLAVLEDKQDARKMFVDSGGSLQSKIAEKVFSQSLIMICGLIVANVACVVVVSVESWGVPPAAATAAGSLFGVALGNAWRERSTIVDFLFGSSQGSKDKDSIADVKKQLKG